MKRGEKPGTWWALVVCFLCSGAGALGLQVTWSREVASVLGNSDATIAVVLASNMGGLWLGAVLASRGLHKIRAPIRFYAGLELAVALCASVFAPILSVFREHLLVGGNGALVLAALLLLIPTTCMGATLPVLSYALVERVEEIGPRVGGLYAVNTGGAILGAFLTGAWLLPEFGLARARWVAISMFLVAGLAALLLGRLRELRAADQREPSVEKSGFDPVLLAIGLSGAASFSLEVQWTRALEQVLGASTLAFAVILTSFLTGIAAGSLIAGRLAPASDVSRRVLVVLHGATGACAWLGYWGWLTLAPHASGLGLGPHGPLWIQLGLPLLVMLPTTLALGASVPVAVRAITALAKQTGQNTARVIAWNTLGAAVGALGTGLIVLPTVGFEGAIRFAAGLCFLAATVVLWRVARRPGIRALALLAIAVVLWVPAKEAEPLLRASSMRGARPDGLLLYSAVGRASSVVALARHRGVLLRTNGLPEARVSYAGSLSKVSPAAWMAALPSLARPSARRAMVIGLGAGNTLAGFLPWVERIDVAEIE
ncbi:MAG: fused MFS/spermidine synthase, partial [Myxococcota bacterium]